MVVRRASQRVQASRVMDAHASAARLPDGTYDAFIVWAETRDDGSFAFDITITVGEHRGDVVTVIADAGATRATFGTRDAFALVGVPCTLRVAGGRPTVLRG
jgi:hypothetical protein